jgi:hypothetical protein
MTYKNEFPDFDDVLPSLEGFQDSSWHNDACPSLRMELKDGKYWHIFMDYKDQNLSDFADIDPTTYKRFAISLMDEEGFQHEGENFDTWEELTQWLENFLANEHYNFTHRSETL